MRQPESGSRTRTNARTIPGSGAAGPDRPGNIYSSSGYRRARFSASGCGRTTLECRAVQKQGRLGRVERRLAAIPGADVAGYSRLIGAAEGPYICNEEKAMPGPLADDPIVKRFRAALTDLYGDRLERVVLFGSRARGDAREDSDYDIAVFVKDIGPFWDEVDRLVDVETDLLYDTGAVINSTPFRAGAYHDRTSLMREIRREGVDL